MKKGDTYTSYPSGGGGWGDPLQRDPAAVADDLRDEIISADVCKNIYGVVVNVDDFSVDVKGTEKLRGELLKKRTKGERHG